MIYIVIALSVIIIGCLSARLLLLKNAMKDAGKQLQEINRTPEENRFVKLSVPNREMEELLTDINNSLQIIRREKIVYAKREEAFKQQMENISHDLRTPLTSMIGYLRIVDKSGFSVEAQEDLDTVIRKAERLKELISQFYDFTRVTASEYTVPMERIELTKILREALMDAYMELSAGSLEVNVTIPDTMVTVMANENALQRVFQNLLQNAARYAKSSLEVLLEEVPEGVTVCFANDVTDSNAIDVSRLFERFYTQDPARTGGSTGLGLTIAKQFVEKMGGSIEAQLEGKLLCIRIRLPEK